MHGHMLSMIGMKLLEHCMKKNCKKTIQKEFRIEKIIKKEVNKLHIKWKGYENLFNSGIDKKNVISK